MPAWQSIRFRLSVQYSAVVFGLGGALLGLVYIALRRWLQSQTMMTYALERQWVEIDGVRVSFHTLEPVQMKAIETVYAEIVLNEVAKFTLFAVIALFVLSLIVGWIMSGRVLKPVEEITDVARDIQASDLSRRIALEGPDDELTRLASTFDEMLERLDAAFTSQRQFLADTSHDLRTPLAVIRSNVEVVTSDEDASADEWREVGAIVQRNAEKMSEMIDGLLAAARLQTGKAQAVTLDLATLVEAKAGEYEPIAAASEVSIETDPEHALVEGVEVSLDRALSNLLDNAIGVSPARSTVRVGSGVLSGWAWLAVSDLGPGLPSDPEDIRVGLGLSIVEQIVGAHGGALATFEGDGGTGTTMVMWIPQRGTTGSHPDSSPLTAG